MREAAKQSKTISLVRVDGSPTVAFQGTFRTDAANDVARKQRTRQLPHTDSGPGRASCSPKTPEADVLAALSTKRPGSRPRAALWCSSTPAYRPQARSGSRTQGTFGADPTEVVDYLSKRA